MILRKLRKDVRRRPPTQIRRPKSLSRNRYSVDEEAGLMHGFMGIGHATPWSQMSAIARKKFQHSYSRHAHEFGLPSWSAKTQKHCKLNLMPLLGKCVPTPIRCGWL